MVPEAKEPAPEAPELNEPQDPEDDIPFLLMKTMPSPI